MGVDVIIIYFGIGMLAGLMSGILGIGGGSVRIPLLNLVGLPLVNAYGINLLIIPFSSMVGAMSHRDNLDRHIAKYVILGGVGGSVVGAFFVGTISSLWLAVLFVTISAVTVIGIYLEKLAPWIARKVNPNPMNITVGTFFLNLLTGMRGGSGGSLFPSFLKTMGLNIRRAIATSLFSTVFTASAGLLVYYGRGDILWLPAVLVLAGSLLGVRIGSLISMRTKPRWLEASLAVVVMALAAIVLYKALIM